jgi:diacylglycerol kinase (ATP)
VRATLIVNPRAGRGADKSALLPAIDVLHDAGWLLTVCETTVAGHAESLAREAVEQEVDTVLVAGGDGTLNEVVQALAGTQTALAYLPTGTVNVWARELGLPLDPVLAARAIVAGRRESIDLGRALNRYFLLMASVGFDAEVLRRARRLERHKQRFGVLPYVLAGLATAPIYRGTDVELRYDGVIRRVQALMIIVANTRLYGGRFRFTPNAVANDGWLDLCIVKGRGPVALARQSVPLLLLSSSKHADVEVRRVRNLSISAPVALPWQVDGEMIGSTPLHISIAPRALTAIVPTGTSNLIA